MAGWLKVKRGIAVVEGSRDARFPVRVIAEEAWVPTTGVLVASFWLMRGREEQSGANGRGVWTFGKLSGRRKQRRRYRRP